jgi:hypothetical protein
MCAKKVKLNTSVEPKKACRVGRLTAKPEKDIIEVNMPLNPKFRGR